jgi:hypothetical protein
LCSDLITSQIIYIERLVVDLIQYFWIKTANLPSNHSEIERFEEAQTAIEFTAHG